MRKLIEAPNISTLKLWVWIALTKISLPSLVEQTNMLLHYGIDRADNDKCTSHFSENEGDVLWLDGVQAYECIWN